MILFTYNAKLSYFHCKVILFYHTSAGNCHKFAEFMRFFTNIQKKHPFRLEEVLFCMMIYAISFRSSGTEVFHQPLSAYDSMSSR